MDISNQANQSNEANKANESNKITVIEVIEVIEGANPKKLRLGWMTEEEEGLEEEVEERMELKATPEEILNFELNYM